ncbi:hypothetical protein ACLOJK_034018 [Asimina triloba]
MGGGASKQGYEHKTAVIFTSVQLMQTAVINFTTAGINPYRVKVAAFSIYMRKQDYEFQSTQLKHICKFKVNKWCAKHKNCTISARSVSFIDTAVKRLLNDLHRPADGNPAMILEDARRSELIRLLLQHFGGESRAERLISAAAAMDEIGRRRVFPSFRRRRRERGKQENICVRGMMAAKDLFLRQKKTRREKESLAWHGR